MFNLIRRDVILQKRLLMLFIPCLLFLIIMDANPAFIFLFASIYIPFNTYAYDEKTETNILLNSLPYTRNEIIASRYLGALVYMVLAVAITSLILLLFNRSFTIIDIALSIGLFLLFVAIALPLFYIFKPGYISPILMFSFIFLAIIGPRIVSFAADHLTVVTNFLINLSNPILYTGSALAALTVYGASWGFTTFVYKYKAL
ncbi:ABC-2 type transport system permease protein [Terribacillus aidingensis]|uniref:ABC-2 type transport system permease protein n=1 Tax=Terribacillus aidingensis TaxID=586416 RepID=A0A285NQ03_9BACI|nr:ABC-2 transporter permease [Terribacillus aidingensis]SNZ11604.1 ABC-2 type transport system permease protein [Terribacillus aidingensis]